MGLKYQNVEDTTKIADARKNHEKAVNFWRKVVDMFSRNEANKDEYDEAFKAERKAFKDLEEAKNK